MRYNLFLFTILMTVTLIGGGLVYPQDAQASFDYSLYAKVLQTYVNEEGRVDYEGLKANSGDLDQFIEMVENADISRFSDEEKKAFWINAYNAITLKVITKSYPTKSIRLINFGLVWEVPRRAAQGKYSLGHIEHKIVRPMGDPRIHFALNCASIGCPELPTEPFYPERLNLQLEREAIKFLSDPGKIRIDKEKKILYHSAILDWFEEDFLAVSPDILGYIKNYINEEDRAYLDAHDVSLKVLKYDWGLNKQ